MKRLWIIAPLMLAAACATGPTPTAQREDEAVVARAPMRKERQEESRTPVVVKETVAFADGVVDKVIEYGYDAGYARLQSTATSTPSAAGPIERVSFEYRAGILASKSTFGADGTLSSRSDYTFGSRGEPLKEATLDGNGRVQSVSEWTWDNGRKSSWRVVSASGAILARTDYFYEGDELASTLLLDGSGNVKGKIVYVYAEGNRLAQQRYFDATGAQDGRLEYAWKDGRIAEESVYRADGRLERRLSYGYGPDGALVSRALADASGITREIVRYENAYRVETRTVVYYE